MPKIFRCQSLILEVFLVVSIVGIVAYSLFNFYTYGGHIDFPPQYHWNGDYLLVGYLKRSDTQPIIVVVEDSRYQGDIWWGGSGDCKAFSDLPAKLCKGKIINVEGDMVRLRYLGEEKIIEPQDVWIKELQRIEIFKLASYSTRVEYLNYGNTIGEISAPFTLEYKEKFPVIVIQNSIHTYPIPFLNIFHIKGQIFTTLLCLISLVNGYYLSTKKDWAVPTGGGKFCIYCGVQLSAEAPFCQSCGKKQGAA